MRVLQHETADSGFERDLERVLRRCAPDRLVIMARVWPGDARLWITSGCSSQPCIDRDAHLRVLECPDDRLAELCERLRTRWPRLYFCRLEPLYVHASAGTETDAPGASLVPTPVRNVDIFRAVYHFDGETREIWWCRHCLSLANEAPLLSWNKIRETDCSDNGRGVLCERRRQVRRTPRLRFASSSLRRCMRTALVLAGARPRGGGGGNHLGCDPAERDDAPVPVHIYPDIKEHMNPFEDALRHVMHTQNTTDRRNIRKTRRELNKAYEGAHLRRVAWTDELLAIARSNEPDYRHFLQSTLFSRPELAGPDPTLIVSHGWFLKRYVLGRYSPAPADWLDIGLF